MTTRDEMVEAGCDALPLVVWRELSMEDVVGYVLDAVEPLIRANEYGKCAARLDDMDYFMTNTRARTLTELRAKVKALQSHYTPFSSHDAFADVLALFDGGSDD
jgi:hypothetical protein